MAVMKEPHPIRVIDLAPLVSSTAAQKHGTDPTDRTGYAFQEIAERVNESFAQTGFLIVVNHGVPQQLIQSVRAQAREFFVDTSNKQKASCVYRAPVPRGFSGNAKENFAILVGDQKPNDLVEKYRMGPWRFDAQDPYFVESKDAQMMFYPNKWPDWDDHKLQQAMETYYLAMEQLMRVLLEVFEHCFGLPTGFFTSKVDKHTSILSVNHYPPIQKQLQKQQLRLAEHTDVDLFTVLCPDYDDAYGCLQAKNAQSDWSPVPIIDDSLIVNVGDCFDYWTKGKWKSTLHRVIVPGGKEARATGRIAIAFFAGANYDATLDPLFRDHEQDDGNETHQGASRPVTYVEWRKDRVQRALNKLPKK